MFRIFIYLQLTFVCSLVGACLLCRLYVLVLVPVPALSDGFPTPMVTNLFTSAILHLSYSVSRLAMIQYIWKHDLSGQVISVTVWLLGFMWWPDEDISKEVIESYINTHVFRATSSLAFATFIWCQTVSDIADHAKAVEIVIRPFYVNDCLKPLEPFQSGKLVLFNLSFVDWHSQDESATVMSYWALSLRLIDKKIKSVDQVYDEILSENEDIFSCSLGSESWNRTWRA